MATFRHRREVELNQRRSSVKVACTSGVWHVHRREVYVSCGLEDAAQRIIRQTVQSLSIEGLLRPADVVRKQELAGVQTVDLARDIVDDCLCGPLALLGFEALAGELAKSGRDLVESELVVEQRASLDVGAHWYSDKARARSLNAS